MLNREKTGLIVVDIQGKLARLVHESDTFLANCATLIKGAKALELPLLLVEQNPEKLGTTVDELAALLTDVTPITKYTFNACDTPLFLEAIKSVDIDTWLICGIEAHICVYQTAKGLTELGYNVELVGDCVSSRTETNKQLGLARLSNSGIDITGVEMCLYELVKDCKTTAFKDILTLVR